MKKTPLTLFLLFNFTLVFCQFDRPLFDPINENPSYVGSTGKHRVSGIYEIEKSKNKQLLSYDFFLQKIGGVGFSASNKIHLDGRELNLSAAFSPKITQQNKDVTWSPAIALNYNRMYQRKERFAQSYFKEYFDSLGYDFSTVRTSVKGTFSLARNSNKTVQGVVFSFDPWLGVFENKADFLYKFNKKDKGFSSTAGLGYDFINYGNKSLYETSRVFWPFDLWGVKRGEMIGSRQELPKQALFLRASYWLSFKNLSAGVDVQEKIWQKMKVTDVKLTGREVSGLHANRSSIKISMSYKYKNIAFLGGFEAAMKDIIRLDYETSVENDMGNTISSSGWHAGMRPNYKRLSFGVKVNW